MCNAFTPFSLSALLARVNLSSVGIDAITDVFTVLTIARVGLFVGNHSLQRHTRILRSYFYGFK